MSLRCISYTATGALLLVAHRLDIAARACSHPRNGRPSRSLARKVASDQPSSNRRSTKGGFHCTHPDDRITSPSCAVPSAKGAMAVGGLRQPDRRLWRCRRSQTRPYVFNHTRLWRRKDWDWLGQFVEIDWRALRGCCAHSHRQALLKKPLRRGKRTFPPSLRKGEVRPIAVIRLPYSMTSSTRARIDCGKVRPRALAVLRLTTSSKVVGCWTGRSTGLVPFRIFPV